MDTTAIRLSYFRSAPLSLTIAASGDGNVTDNKRIISLLLEEAYA
jgi:hypothetical protein